MTSTASPLRASPAPDQGWPGIAAIVHGHAAGLWRFLRLLGCQPAEADDLTQECFLVAMRKGLAERPVAEVAPLLRTVARHLWLRHREKEGRRAELLAAAAEELWQRRCPDQSGEAAVAALRACVQRLDGRARELVRRFYGEQQARTVIAAAFGMQENGVKTMLQRVRAALRECLSRRLA